MEKHYGVITLVRCQPQTQFNVRGCQLKLLALLPSYQTLLIQSRVYIILVRDHKSSFSQSIATRVLPVIVHLPCQDSLMMLNPICVSQPCSLTERKKSRVGSVVMPYILSSTLRRMSTVSTLSNASSGLSSGSASSDGPSCISSQESVPASSSCFLCLPYPLVWFWVCDDALPSLQGLLSSNTDFDLRVLNQNWLYIFLYLFPHPTPHPPPQYSQAVPCYPVPVIAGPRFCPAPRRTTGLLERTGKSGVWANPRSYWRGSQMQMRWGLMFSSYFYIYGLLFSFPCPTYFDSGDYISCLQVLEAISSWY